MNDEFYIGWQKEAPSGMASYVKKTVIALLILVAVIGGMVGASQNPVAPGFFDFGNVVRYEGTLVEWPLPFLRADDGTAYLLCGAGKFGPPAAIHGHDGKRIAFGGTLIRRESQQMLEVTEPDTFEVLGDGAMGAAPIDEVFADVTLAGELVDTKCWSGVMRPATGKVHRGCAVRCLSGGVPPGLMVRDDHGNASVVILAGGGDDEQWEFDPEWAARILEVRGKLKMRNGIPFLHVESAKLLDGEPSPAG